MSSHELLPFLSEVGWERVVSTPLLLELPAPTTVMVKAILGAGVTQEASLHLC